MCLCACACMHTCTYSCTHMPVGVHAYMCVCVNIIYVFMCKCVQTYMCTVYTYIYTHTYITIYSIIYTHTDSPQLTMVWPNVLTLPRCKSETYLVETAL